MATKLDSKSVRAEIEATHDKYTGERRDEFVTLIRDIQQAATPREFVAAQMDLRDRFAGRQDGMNEIRQRLAANKAELRRLAPRKPQPRDQVKEIGERIAIRERILLRESVIQHTTRCLADALVWRATRYDRALFSVLGEGERVGRFPDEAGAEVERRRAQEIWDFGALPFFNDLTNCLRQGDLTILHGQWPDADVAIGEVKRSERHRLRQTERLDRKVKFLNEGRDPRGADGEELGLHRLPIAYRHGLDALAAILAQARRTGYAETQPHAALVVSAVDLGWAIEHRHEAGDYMSRAARARGWDLDDERLFADSALVRRLRERRRAGSAYHAPLGIFPLCAEDIADPLMARFDYTAILRVDALEPAFTARAIDVRFATGTDAEQVFLYAVRGADEVVVPAHLRDQMLRELMTVETLVDTVDLLLESGQGPASGQRKCIVACDEGSSWGQAPEYLAF